MTVPRYTELLAIDYPQLPHYITNRSFQPMKSTSVLFRLSALVLSLDCWSWPTSFCTYLFITLSLSKTHHLLFLQYFLHAEISFVPKFLHHKLLVSRSCGLGPNFLFMGFLECLHAKRDHIITISYCPFVFTLSARSSDSTIVLELLDS